MAKNETSMYVEILQEELGISEEEVREKIKRAREEFQLPLKYYANHQLYRLNDEELKKQSEIFLQLKDKRLERLIEVTGWTKEYAQLYISRVSETYHVTLKEILSNLLYEKNEEEIKAWKEDVLLKKQQRIERIMEKTGWDEDRVKQHIAKCKVVFGVAVSNYENTRCYELSDEELRTYANQEDSRFLGEKYITKDSDILKNKIVFDETYEEFIGRKFWVNRDNDYASFKKFVGFNKAVFCKPIDLAGGHGVYRKEVSFTKRRELYDFLMKQPKMVVEEVIKQHPVMNEFYSGSINTIRVFSIIKDGKFDAFASFVRFGVQGVVDNVSSGGIACGVDPKDGRIITPAMGEDGIIYEKHPVSGKQFEGFVIPYWQEVLALTEKALRKVEGVDYVGWDVAITPKGPILVEGNNIPCLSIYQSLFAYRKEGRKFTYEKYL